MRVCMILLATLLVTAGCHESIEDRAAREAREYTQRYCPTPAVNGVRTDSVAFDTQSHIYTYYCTFMGKIDDAALVSRARAEIHSQLTESIHQSTKIKKYKEAGFIFAYICRSEKNPRQILYSDRFTQKDYR